MTVAKENAELKAENARLREEICAHVAHYVALAERVQKLEATLAKDSHNSGIRRQATDCAGSPRARASAAGSSPDASRAIAARRCISRLT
jgi:hypothetical protein